MQTKLTESIFFHHYIFTECNNLMTLCATDVDSI